MRKYFGNKQQWTIEELISLVSKHPQLGFYWESIFSPIDGSITIHNHNGQYQGRNSRTFVQKSNNVWMRR